MATKFTDSKIIKANETYPTKKTREVDGLELTDQEGNVTVVTAKTYGKLVDERDKIAAKLEEASKKAEELKKKGDASKEDIKKINIEITGLKEEKAAKEKELSAAIEAEKKVKEELAIKEDEHKVFAKKAKTNKRVLIVIASVEIGRASC